MKKKVVSMVVAATLMAAMLVGCGSNGSSSTAKNDTKTENSTKTENNGGSAELGKIYLVSKGFQHQFWQAVLQGANEAAAEYGVEVDFQGPDNESAYAQQVQMLNNAINNNPPAIGLAALDTESCMDSIKDAQSKGIPIVGFDSGVPGAPEGAIVANASTDNYAAGKLAGEETYKLLKDQIASATSTVRIGVMNQDATAESITNRNHGL